MNAATLSAPIRFEGVGLHTGADARMELRPADPGTGIVFVLDGVRVPALADFAQESPLATVLARDGKSVTTIEHALSALLAMGVSDVEIALDGPEAPILDGSARPYVEAIATTGLRESPHARPVLEVTAPIELRDGDRAVIVMPSDAFRVRFVGDYPAPIGTHYIDIAIDPERYRTEIASARTFTFLRDVEAMRARGLARGGSLENALVYDEDGPMQPLQWPNEVVRHKVLDLIGDLALVGAYPRCEVIAIKSGHALHTRVARELRKRG
ncbi:MAG: UDP-3-O-[3-hydroxymyristoyl] N-acetylglucosamine deacetylase [bacterium]|nr:UDP-3-O-[3-hydroxymyristoyl] N-acetylglucosamine deacetylase [bacterium]